MEGYSRKSYRFGPGVGPKITTVPTTIGKFKRLEAKEKPIQNVNERKLNSFSIFFLTVNTNLNMPSPRKSDREREEKAEKLRDVIDSLFGDDPGAGGNCDFLEFFKLVPGKYPVYANDNSDYEKWCGYFKEIWIKGTTEWSGKEINKRYLHAHAIIKVLHSTRIHLNKETIAEYIKNSMGLNHLPYVHIDMVNPSLYYVMKYIEKDVPGDENPVDSIKQENMTDAVIINLTKKMENLNINKQKKYW